MFSVNAADLNSNTWWSDPIFFGTYPEDGLRAYGVDPPIRGDDFDMIRQDLDFYGANIYSGHRTTAGQDGDPVRVPADPGAAANALNWAVEPDALYWGPRFFHERYGKPVVITENGFAGRDWVSLDGAVHDPQRIDYTRRYLLSLERAIADGVPVGGYFHWTFVDDFEWAEGYKDRFGLVFCDFQTLERIPKDSARWHAEVIRTNGPRSTRLSTLLR
jgi:beta-glucosidase